MELTGTKRTINEALMYKKQEEEIRKKIGERIGRVKVARNLLMYGYSINEAGKIAELKEYEIEILEKEKKREDEMGLAITKVIRKELERFKKEGKEIDKVETAERLLKKNYKIGEIEYITQLDKREINIIMRRMHKKENRKK